MTVGELRKHLDQLSDDTLVYAVDQYNKRVPGGGIGFTMKVGTIKDVSARTLRKWMVELAEVPEAVSRYRTELARREAQNKKARKK